MPPKLIDITNEVENDSDPIQMPSIFQVNKEEKKEEVEEDKTPIVEQIPPKPKTQGYKPPPRPVIRAPEPYRHEKETPSIAVVSAMAGLIAVILASPMFKGLLEKVMPSLATGYMFYLFVFLLATLMFMAGSRLIGNSSSAE
jgi:hypothetical protein